MPEPVGILWSMPETKKKAPIIKVSCGIGDTDGFPAFDVESDAYDSKDDTKWGFLITGGAEFHMPLTVFQVTPDGLADKSGIRLGDIILEINEEDASQLTLAQAHERINATPKKVQFLMRNMEEDDPTGMFEAGEEKSIVMRVPKPMPPPKGRVLPTSIELRLLEMQRKLSAIAEIPKILSSTLATVSQSFDSLEAEASYKRKCSYDEDALDYELHEQPESECDSELDESDDAEDDEEDDLVQVQDDNDAEDAVHKLKSESLKDATPESDYASEANYATNETSDEPDNGNDYEDDEVRYDEEAVFYLKLPAGADIDADADTDNTTRHTEIAARATAQLRADAVKNISSECDSSDLDEDEDEVAKDNNDSDFLSTTYTWNLRNVPKLRINDAEGVCNLTLLSPQLEQHNTIDDTSKVRAATPTPTPTPTPASMSTSTTSTEEAAHSQSQKLLFKLDNLERSWPWADREKIIYKQSTCHLVPRKPLGIVGQRIQLLAKQELQRKDKAQ
ncbi:uncharacterized protein LOC133846253 isoform X1 [Drosophila sulfurigaster albostrigata]|uniref:uncharacterized protein LOC133846253 isoform X1 n=2 Tax=Drosophila sulfurigaster albostrigata TaxID=89887 RepID=UPI002D21D276|nr:uncharacterized protein LOC133846253 isoform X1 [Drosophila sulfurigaster albostrigata]